MREQKAADPEALEATSVDISEEGLRIETRHELILRRWPAILQFVDYGRYVFIYFAPRAVFVVPVSAFG